AMTSPELAEPLVERGISTFKSSARLRMYRGIVREMKGHISDGDLHDPTVIAQMVPGAGRRWSVMAEASYREALRVDSTLAEARRHLGRILTLRNEPTEARRELEAAAAAASDPRNKHLARLFLGALAELDHDWPAARNHYAEALLLVPS